MLPPSASSTVIAFSKDRLVKISLGLGGEATANFPVSSATRSRWEPFAEGVALPSGAIPRASVIHAIVEAARYQLVVTFRLESTHLFP